MRNCEPGDILRVEESDGELLAVVEEVRRFERHTHLELRPVSVPTEFDEP